MSGEPLLLRRRAAAGLVLTCEHASADVPLRFGDLGLSEAQRRDHIGWDIGAAFVTDELSSRLASPAVLSSVSRLVIDCNRRTADQDLIPLSSHGVVIPSNQAVDAAERGARLRDYYRPYHRAIDHLLHESASARLLSIHSFTPDYEGRDFDVGVLFDDHEEHAGRIAAALLRAGFRVRMNEPYSGFAGLIYSARSHGRRFRRHYLELEINNGLLRSESAARSIAAKLTGAVAAFAEGQE